MTILGFPFFSLFSSQSKPDRIRKSIGPISNVIKRQPFTTSSHQLTQHPHVNKATSDYFKFKQDRSSHHQEDPEVITESSILSNFPRPNLMPTLHFSLFGSSSPPSESKKCTNCSGPHSTDFCPC
jgi:hypothetical protein